MVGFWPDLGMRALAALIFLVFNSLGVFLFSKILQAKDSGWLAALFASLELAIVILVLSYLPDWLGFLSMVLLFVALVYVIEEYYFNEWRTIFLFVAMWVVYWIVLYSTAYFVIFTWKGAVL